MNYEQHKAAMLKSHSVPSSVQRALMELDSMDCVKALAYVNTLHEMMSKRVMEACEVRV